MNLKSSLAAVSTLACLLGVSCAPVDDTSADGEPTQPDENSDPTGETMSADESGAPVDQNEGSADETTAEGTSVDAISYAGGTHFRAPLNSWVRISSPFLRNHRSYNCTYYSRTSHRGVDFAVGVGTPVYAAAPGTVIWAKNDCPTYGYLGSQCGSAGWGNHVILLHSNGRTSFYGHLQNGSVRVRVGNTVSCGTQLGRSGSSGNSSGPHVHFEVRDGGSRSYPYAGTSKNPMGGSCSTQSGTMWRSGTNTPGTRC